MKRVYANSQYAKPCERYCREVYPDEAEQIFKKSRGVLSQVHERYARPRRKHDGEEYAGLIYDPRLL